MVFHNNDNGYKPVVPNDEAVMTPLSEHREPRVRDGLFYRSDLEMDLGQLAINLIEHPFEASVQDYQYWSEAGWKTPHGSYDSVERFANKLVEEQAELTLAVFEDLRTTRDHVLEEAGDVLWVTTALASVAIADIDSGLKNLLFEYVMGVQHFKDGEVIEPRWRQAAAKLATKYGQITISDLEGLIREGFEPLPSSVMNIYDPEEDNEDVDQHLLTVMALGFSIKNAIQQQYGGDSESRAEGDITYPLPSAFYEYARTIGGLSARMYLELAFITERSVDRGLSDVVSMNVAKISERINSGTIDKTDGERNPEA